MANERSIEVTSLPTTTPGHFINLRIYFNDNKYYVLAITPAEHKPSGLWSTMLFSGKSLRIERAQRFSLKRLRELKILFHAKHPEVAPLIQEVLKKEGKELAK